MPRKGTMQINITFRRDEADLYDWLKENAGEEGMSSYIKRLIRRDMMKDAAALQIIIKKAFSEWAWCPRCGTHAELRNIEETPLHIKLVYWCSECGMGYNKTINKTELDNINKISEIMGRVAKTIPNESVDKHEKLKKLGKSDLVKILRE